MRTKRSIALLGLLFLLLPLAVPASAQPPASGPALVVVTAPDTAALARLEGTGLPAYGWLPDGRVLVGADAAGQESLAQAGLAFQVLDPAPAGGAFYLASLAPGRPAPAWAQYGIPLLIGNSWALLRVAPGDIPRLTAAGVEVRAVFLTPVPLRPALAAPPACERCATSSLISPPPDPFVQLIMDQVISTTIYSYTGGLTGEWPILVGGNYVTVTTRNTESEPIQWAIQYAGNTMEELGLAVEYQDWSLQGVSGTNVIGVMTGTLYPDQVYIICAHLDDEPQGPIAPGADDNGSGSVAVLVAADLLTSFPSACTIKFALWTGEEQGLLGSYVYAARAAAREENILGVLNLDMISWNTPMSAPGMYLEGHPQITETFAMTELFSDVVAAYDLDLIPHIELVYDSGSDHASFWRFGYPAILAIEDWYDFNPYYHSVEDNLAHQDLAYYTEMVKAAVGTLVHMSGCLIPAGVGALDGYVTAEADGAPIPQADIAVQGTDGRIYPADTDAAGYYTRTLLPGTYTVTASAYGYVTTTVTGVVVLSDTVTALDIALPDAAMYLVSGTVTAEGTGAPLPAQVSFRSTPVQVETDPATGFYSATVAEGHYTMRVASYGYALAERTVTVDHDQTQDWSLEKLPCVLLVDDDQDMNNFRPYYTSTLNYLGYSYDVWDVQGQGDPPAERLIGYPVVVWYTGYPDADTLKPTNEQALSEYLDAGGGLFLSSEGFLWDMGVDGFARDRLGVGAFRNRVWDDDSIAGNRGDPVGDGLGPYMPSPPYGWPWFFTADITATQAAPFRWDSVDRDNSARYEGGTFKTVFLPWPLEGLPDVADRAAVLGRVVDWFGGCATEGLILGTVTDAASGDPLPGAAVTAAPGPFTATAGLGGHYTLTLPAGPYTVTASYTGYLSRTAAVTVAAGLTVTRDFALTPACEPVRAVEFGWVPTTPTVGQVVSFTAQSGGWLIETVDSTTDAGYWTSLVLDTANLPHISYFGDGEVRYAHHDGSSWQIEIVTHTGQIGHNTALALDGIGRPHISYFDAARNDLKYAYNDGLNWQVETVDSALGPFGGFTSLALDPVNHAHISYCDQTNSSLKYAYYDGTSWQIEMVDYSSFNTFGFTSLALDTAGHPHISYSFTTKKDQGPDYLKYAYHDGLTWQIEVVDYPWWGNTSLTLDVDGHPHIAYDRYVLRYANYDGSTWQTETVDNYGTYASLALDSAGQPHIGYEDGTLKYAYRDGAGWYNEIVDGSNQAGQFVSVALDSTGSPHLSYYAATQGEGELRYAQYLPIPTPPITYTWDWDDGSSSLAPCPLPTCSITHTYTLPGAYTVTLTATNACGEKGVTHRVVVVPEAWRVYLPVVGK